MKKIFPLLLVFSAFAQTPQILDQSATVGPYTSIQVVNTFPSIAYYDATNDQVKFIQSDSTDGSTWGNDPVVVTSGGRFISMAVLSGSNVPIIAYMEDLDLKVIVATDNTGTSWNSPVTIASNVCHGMSLTLLVSNVPAVAYCDATTGLDLAFLEADDTTGLNWGGNSVVYPDASSGVGQYPSMTLVLAGNPAISYRDVSNNQIKYVGASVADGSAWDPPVSIAGTTGGSQNVLLYNGGFPGIAYWKTGPDFDLDYVLATNPTGSAWGVSLKLAEARGFISAAYIGSQPAVVYYGEDKDLVYVLAINHTIGSWGSPVVLDSEGDVGRFTSMVSNSSERAVSYYDYTNRSLKFMVYTPTPTPTPTATSTPTPTPTPTP